MVQLPEKAVLEQIFDSKRIDGISTEVSGQIATLAIEKKIKPGDSVAVTAGSRGIQDIDTIMRAAVKQIQAMGGVPFIFPAMGSHKGAQYYHQAAISLTFPGIIETVAMEIIRRCPILFGLGIIENAYDETCTIEALAAEEIPEGEKTLLVEAKSRMAKLPFDEIDVLIVDRIGKNGSGTGMDTNVTGRNRDILGDFTSTPHIKRIFVRDLKEETEGNATGIGFADFTTARLVEKIDRKKTYVNSLTGISPEKAAIPMYFDTDAEAIEACLKIISDVAAVQARFVHIRSTLHMRNIAVSRAFESEIASNPSLRRMTE